MHHAKSTVPVFFKISVDHLFDKLESEKDTFVWKNKKAFNFGFKNLYKLS